MIQRTLTGVISAALLLTVIYLGGWVLDIAVMLVAMLGCYEMLGAFSKAGLSPARWPVFGMSALMLPVFRLFGSAGVYLLVCSATMVVMLQMALRRSPKWQDAAASFNVLISVPIPLSLLYPIVRIQPEALGALLILSVFVIALVGDTFAYFVGVALGKHKMAPELSPKKTWEGAAAGLLGSVVGAGLLCTSSMAITPMPPLWHFLLLGLFGGIAGQLGDLTASLIKRFCGIKDFGTLFPGHGCMMDRVDSVIFVSYVVFGYCMAAGLL
jgi:phosphatidate cytidylyltransferase